MNVIPMVKLPFVISDYNCFASPLYSANSASQTEGITSVAHVLLYRTRHIYLQVQRELDEVQKLDQATYPKYKKCYPERLIARKSQGIRGYIHATLRHFYWRVRKFILFIKGDDTIFGGKVIEHFVRFEFQDRGYPHAHILYFDCITLL